LSIKVIQWVWDCSSSKNAERLVLLAIADNAADDGSHAYPSIAELCRKANLSERAVRDALRRLESLGELKTHIGGGRGGTNYYTVIMTPCDQKKGADSAPPAKQNPAESAGGEGQILPGGGAESAPGTVLEPSYEPSVSTFDAETAPTARTILGAFIDWIGLPAQGGVKLSKRVIGIYAKSIKELLGEGFSENLIKMALVAMLEKNLTDRPTLLHNFVVQVQQQAARPVSAPPAPRTFKQMDESDREREHKIILAMDVVLQQDDSLSASEARKIVMDLINAGQLDLNALSTSAPTGYIEQDVIVSEVKEVTGS
jgi:hypothetical protein